MEDFGGKLAVITGAGTGIGRELALQLVGAGAHVAICDVFSDTLAEARAACEAAASPGTRVSAHLCDVSNEGQVVAFCDAVLREHQTDHIELLFNNAGIAGGGSFISDPREQWEKTFNVCWFGVYYCTRAFLPCLIRSSAGCIVNTSSVNGFYALLPTGPHTAYSAAKFAVKGFTEALVSDLRSHAPHVRAVLVMPGHVGTSIVTNTMRSQGVPSPSEMTSEMLATARQRLTQLKVPHEQLDDEQVRSLLQERIENFRKYAGLTPAQAATLILEGIGAGRWRLLLGDDAHQLDRIAREHPEELYEPTFVQQTFADLYRVRRRDGSQAG